MVIRREAIVRSPVARCAVGATQRERRPGSRRVPARPRLSLRAQRRIRGRAAGLMPPRAARLIVRRYPLGGLSFIPGEPLASLLTIFLFRHGSRASGCDSVARGVRTASRPFLILHDDHMTLYNMPVPCKCGKHSYQSGIPEGLTHRPNDPCPFKDDNFPIGLQGGCCGLRGKRASRELEALGMSGFFDRMHKDMTAEEALDFSEKLRACADRLNRKYGGSDIKPHGAGWNATGYSGRKDMALGRYSTFEAALASIVEASRWYAKVGQLGYGVRAW